MSAVAALVALGLVGCSSPPPRRASAESSMDPAPAATSVPSRTQRVSVKADGVELADLLEQIGQQVNRNLLVDPNVDEVVSVDLDRVPWRDAVDVIARMTRCTVEERPGGIVLLTQPKLITIQNDGLGARTLIQMICAYAEQNVIISSEFPDEDPQIPINELHWRVALERIVEAMGPYEVVDGHPIRIMPKQR